MLYHEKLEHDAMLSRNDNVMFIKQHEYRWLIEFVIKRACDNSAAFLFEHILTNMQLFAFGFWA
jgi:hypothetical protein